MSRRLVILRGIPGSGKSTLARRLLGDATAIIASADDLFVGHDRVYRFDPARIGEAHGACFRRAVDAMRLGADVVVIDNTNITAVEVAPYVLAAQAYGYEHEIVTVQCGVALAAERNIHGVPLERVAAMAAALDRETMMPWWNHRVEVAS